MSLSAQTLWLSITDVYVGAISGQRGEAAGAIAEELAPLFRFLSFREWYPTFLAFVDAKCRKHT